MIIDLVTRYGVDTSRSVLIGDKETDLQAAHAAGVKGYLFSGGNLCTFIQSVLAETARLPRRF